MRAVCVSSSSSLVPHFISHIDNSSISTGIQNLEWVVRPFGSNKDTTPDDAIVRTIFLCPLRYLTTMFHKNILPVPQCPDIKKKFGSLFRKLFTIL